MDDFFAIVSNLGIIDNFRKAVDMCDTKYVVFIGADNTIVPEFIEKHLLVAKNNPEGAIYYSDMTIFGEYASILAENVHAEKIGNQYVWRFPDPSKEAIQNLKNANFIHGSSMFRLDWYNKVGGYSSGQVAEDHDLFLRIVREGGQPIHVASPLRNYRQHSNTQINTVRTLDILVDELRAANKELDDRVLAKEAYIEKIEGEVRERDEMIERASVLTRAFGYRDLQSYLRHMDSGTRSSQFHRILITILASPIRVLRWILKRK